MRKVVADAHACGASVPAAVVEKMLTNTEKMAPYRTSMKIDYDECRPSIYGNPSRAAAELAQPTAPRKCTLTTSRKTAH